MVVTTGVVQSLMQLLHSTLQPASTISQAVMGNFTGRPDTMAKLAVVRGTSRIEILRVADTSLGIRLVPLLSCDTFSQIRGLATVQLPGSRRIYWRSLAIVVCSSWQP